MAIKSTPSFIGEQISPQTRTYFIWVWSVGDMAWIRTSQGNPPVPPTNTYKRNNNSHKRSRLGGGPNPKGKRRKRRKTSRGNKNRASKGGSGPPDTQVLIATGIGPGGGIGGTTPELPITSYFPPVSYDIECNASANLIIGGQDDAVIYDITISARGLILDATTDDLITTFNITRTVEVQGPVVGWSIAQVTREPFAEDLELIIYYGLSPTEPNIFEQRYPYDLSLASLPDGFSNLTLEGFDYYFDIEELELVDLRRADGMLNGCEVSAPFEGGQCDTNYNINIKLGYNDGPGFVETGTAQVLNVPGPISAINVIDPETYEKFVNTSPIIGQGVLNQKQWLVRVIGRNITNTVAFFGHDGPPSEMIVLDEVERVDANLDGCGNPIPIAVDGVPFSGGQILRRTGLIEDGYYIFGTYYSKNDGGISACDTVGYFRTINSLTVRVFGSSEVISPTGPGGTVVFRQGSVQLPVAFITQAQFDSRYTGPLTGSARQRGRNETCLSSGDDTIIYGDVWEIVHAFDPSQAQEIIDTGSDEDPFNYPFSGLCDYIEPPQTCIVTVRDLSGIIFEQTYVGSPQIQISEDQTPRPF